MLDLVDVELFHWIRENFYLLVATKVTWFHPLEIMNECTEYHGKPSNS